MADVFEPDQRSAVMRAVKSKNTTPELAVRKAAHAAGLRFRLNRADLPGKPDLVFPASKTALFVHGCFWHGHDCARGARMPATNRDYWQTKIGRNMVRDKASLAALKRLGWRPHVIWECETRDPEKLGRLIVRKLKRSPARPART
ncbi:MAG: very short patch repair endonuclease [Hyphomonadaceae bacterium]|nr:very short patch repair endonuclease [Hyphomonadaceae bacterium]